jgi:hypothetical protein
MIKLTGIYEHVWRGSAYGLFALIALYTAPWLLWGETGFSGATIHPMVVLCAVIATFYGVIAGLTALALSVVPYATFDVSPRSVDELFHNYSLQVLAWPAFSAVCVVLFGAARDLREGSLSAARTTIGRLNRELDVVQKAADAALQALKCNEAEIAMRHGATPLVVIKALARLRQSGPKTIMSDLAHVFWLVAPTSDFALFSVGGETIMASASIRASTLERMRRSVASASDVSVSVKSTPGRASDLENRTILALRTKGASRLVICVACASSTVIEEMTDYLPEIAELIGTKAAFFEAEAGGNEPTKAVA